MVCDYYIQNVATMFHNSFSVFTESGLNDNAATENMLVKALKHVLDYDSFKINTPSTTQARESAERLLDWWLKMRWMTGSMILQSNILQVCDMLFSNKSVYTAVPT